MTPAGSRAVPVPATLDEALTSQWLTAALALQFHDVEVIAVQRGPTVERMSTNARFRITCAEPTPAGLPEQLCIKGYFGEVGRSIQFVGEPEAGFYRDIADSTGVRTLQCVYADVDAATRHGVIVTADVVAAGGRFLGSGSSYTVDQVADSLSQFALLHASTWEDPHVAETRWLDPRIGTVLDHWGESRTREVITANLLGSNGIGMPPHARDPGLLLDALHRVRAEVTALSGGSGWSVIHGDAHVGNLFLDAAGRPHLVDWQLVQRGRWYLDVGYHIASSLPVSARRAAERGLLGHYLNELSGHGVPVPPFEQAWDALAAGIVHGLFLWAITTKVDKGTITELLARLGTAAADHGALWPVSA